VNDLCGHYCLRYAFLSLKPDTLSDDCLQAPAIVQAVSLWIPENRIDVQEIVLQQLLDRERPTGARHVRMVFRAPQVKNQSTRAKAALHSTKGIRGKDGRTQLAANILYGFRPKDNDIDVGRLSSDMKSALQQQVAEQPSHYISIPLGREKSQDGTKVAAGLSGQEVTKGVTQNVRRSKHAIAPGRPRFGADNRH